MKKHLNSLRSNRKEFLNGYAGLEGGADISGGLGEDRYDAQP